MQTTTIVSILIAALICLMTSHVEAQQALLAPPSRPNYFSTPDQLRTYLKALNEYYSIVGRPRFVTYQNNSIIDSRFVTYQNDINIYNHYFMCKHIIKSPVLTEYSTNEFK